MAERRAAVTGLGCISALGVGTEATWQGLCEGASGIRPITAFDAGKFDVASGGQVENFRARDFVPKSYRKAVKVMARDIELAVGAADLGFRDAGIKTRGIDDEGDSVEPGRLGCNIGAGLICSDLNELGLAVNTALVDGKFDLKLWGQTGMSNLTPLWLLKYLPNMLSCHVTIIHGCEGPSNCITCSDASGQMSVGEAARYILRNTADVAIAGGAESKLNPMGMLRQHLLGRLCGPSDDPAAAVRPFDAGHAGTLVGEGGGLLILEDMDRARSRGARVYAEVVGFGGACDPDGADIRRPNAGGISLAVKRAMKDAGIGPEKLGAIMVHGTGVPGEDVAEADGWAEALGDRIEQIPACCLTGAVGSLFAGHGGLEVAIAAKAIAEQKLPATVNHQSPTDRCRLNFSPRSRDVEMEYILSAAFGVGGQSAAVVLKRVDS
ncbi:MAG: beta-ketoacyl-[acyl-carrier-protein] synthase family protein [Phycisphaerae bacterium]